MSASSWPRRRAAAGSEGFAVVGQEDDLGVHQGLQVARHVVVDLEGRPDRADDAASALEHRLGDDVVELAARKPDSLRPFAAEGSGDRGDGRQVGGIAERLVGAGEDDALAVGREEEVGPSVGRLLGFERVDGRRRGERVERHEADDSRIADDDAEGAVELAVAVLLEGLPGGARLLQVVGDLRVGHAPGAVGRDRDRAPDGDQDEQRGREKDLEGEREAGRRRRGQLEAHPHGRPGLRHARAPARLSSAHRPFPRRAD